MSNDGFHGHHGGGYQDHHHHHHHHLDYHSQHHHHRYPSTPNYSGYGYGNGDSRPTRTTYVHYPSYSSSVQPTNFRYIVTGVMAIVISLPIFIFGALFLSGVISSRMSFAGIALLVIGCIVFTVGLITLIASCCICTDPRVIPAHVPGSSSMRVVALQTPNPGIGYNRQPAQPVQPPPYTPKSASPPPYPWPSPTPVGDVTRPAAVHGPYSDQRTSGSLHPPLSSRDRTTPGNNTQVISVQSTASPSSHYPSPQPTRPRSPDRSQSPHRLTVPETNRPSGTTTADVRSSPAPRGKQLPASPNARSSPAPTRTHQTASPDARSSPALTGTQRPASPDSCSSSSVYSALRPSSTDTHPSPLPTRGYVPTSPVNQSNSAPGNARRPPPSDSRSYQRY